MRRQRRMYKFTEKTHSKRAIGAFAVSALLLIAYGFCIHKAYEGGGGLSAYYGSVGVLAMILSVGAFFASLTTFKEEDSFPIFPNLSLATSILASLAWVGTYILGFLQ